MEFKNLICIDGVTMFYDGDVGLSLDSSEDVSGSFPRSGVGDGGDPLADSSVSVGESSSIMMQEGKYVGVSGVCSMAAMLDSGLSSAESYDCGLRPKKHSIVDKISPAVSEDMVHVVGSRSLTCVDETLLTSSDGFVCGGRASVVGSPSDSDVFSHSAGSVGAFPFSCVKTPMDDVLSFELPPSYGEDVGFNGSMCADVSPPGLVEDVYYDASVETTVSNGRNHVCESPPVLVEGAACEPGVESVVSGGHAYVDECPPTVVEDVDGVAGSGRCRSEGEFISMDKFPSMSVEDVDYPPPRAGSVPSSESHLAAPLPACSSLVGDGARPVGPVSANLLANCLKSTNGMTSEAYLHRFPQVQGGFKNLTSVDVPPSVQTLLSYGPKFSVPKVLTFAQYVAHHFDVHGKAQRIHVDASIHLRGFILSSCSRMLESGYVQLSPVEQRLYKMYLQTRTFLIDHPDLVLVEGDKSKCTVLMYATEYSNKMSALIDGYVSRGVYEPIEDMSRVVRLKKRWYKQFLVVKRELVRLWQEADPGSKPFPGTLLGILRRVDQSERPLPYLYGVVKDHKEGTPCRPICSTKGSYSWGLQKVIAHVLTLTTQGMLSDMNVKNVSDVAHLIRSTIMRPGHVLYKLDIVDMYTNMNRADILSVVNQFSQSPAYMARGRLPGILLMRCLELCLGDMTLFSFHGKVFRQISGLPQGAPDSGLLACILLDHTLQVHHYSIFINCAVVFCHKYVDDFLFYLPHDKQQELLSLLQFHTGLSFSVEAEVSCAPTSCEGEMVGEMSFLDLGIVIINNSLHTRMYRKSMASSRTIHYLSNAPLKWKENTLSNRIANVLSRSSNVFLVKDLQDVEMDYQENMYPTLLIQTEMSRMVAQHVSQCKAVSRGGQELPSLTSLGCLRERVRVLYSFCRPVGKFPVARGPHNVRHYPKRFRLDVEQPFPPMCAYSRPVSYVSCETSEVVAEWHRVLSLGKLTHTNVNTLFQLLHMHKRSVDPTMDHANSRSRSDDVVVFLKCSKCCVSFLIRCDKGVLTEEKKRALQRSSSISVHEAQTGHRGILSQVPLSLNLNGLQGIPAHSRVALMQAVYSALGYECKTDAELAILPNIVRLGLLAYLRRYGAPHLEAWVNTLVVKADKCQMRGSKAID